MFPNPGFTLADQIIGIGDCFLKAMRADACTRRLGSLSFAIWVRVKGLERRFCKLYWLWKAGRVPAVRVRRSDGAAGSGMFPVAHRDSSQPHPL